MPTHKLRKHNQRPFYSARRQALITHAKRLGLPCGSLRSRCLVISVEERRKIKAREQARRTEEGRASQSPDAVAGQYFGNHHGQVGWNMEMMDPSQWAKKSAVFRSAYRQARQAARPCV